ncbi:MAG: hypothetical protein CMF52_08395 [Legionellales bacterium]|nr:hypothetical protein [Legionellales bacterium]
MISSGNNGAGQVSFLSILGQNTKKRERGFSVGLRGDIDWKFLMRAQINRLPHAQPRHRFKILLRPILQRLITA